MPVINTHMVTDRGWSEDIIATATGLFSLASVLTSITVGPMIARIGIKAASMLSPIFACIGAVVMLVLDPGEGLYPFVFILFGIANAVAVVTSASMINSWFEYNKSFPMSIMLTSGAFGGFMMPMITQKILGVGLSPVWILYLVLFALTGLLTVTLLKKDPAEIGEVKDSRAWRLRHDISETATLTKAAGTKASSMKGELRNPLFYFFAVMIFAARAIFSVFSAYIVIHSIRNGLTAERAALILSVFSMSSLAGRVLCALSDKVRVPKAVLNIFVFLMMTVGGLAVTTAHGFGMLLTSVLVTGFACGFNTTLLPLLVPEYFPNVEFSTAYGFFTAVKEIAGILCPFLVLFIRRFVDSYAPVYGVMTALCGIVCILSVFARPKQS